MDQVSEVDLTEAKDLRATISGLQVANTSGGASANDGWGNTDAPIVVHFGDSDFQSKYLTVLNDIGQWRAAAGRVESVDLRFNGEAVVNPDRTILAMKKDPPPITRPSRRMRRADATSYASGCASKVGRSAESTRTAPAKSPAPTKSTKAAPAKTIAGKNIAGENKPGAAQRIKKFS